jgi:hypothetical protein
MTQHSSARVQAEAGFLKTQRQAEQEPSRRTNDSAESAAVDAKTARLKELRLNKECTADGASVLITPAPRKEPQPAKDV